MLPINKFFQSSATDHIVSSYMQKLGVFLYMHLSYTCNPMINIILASVLIWRLYHNNKNGLLL